LNDWFDFVLGSIAKAAAIIAAVVAVDNQYTHFLS